MVFGGVEGVGWKSLGRRQACAQLAGVVVLTAWCDLLPVGLLSCVVSGWYHIR